MSYDVSIFFGDRSLGDLREALSTAEQITGLSFRPLGQSSAAGYETTIMGIGVTLMLRAPFLRDTSEMVFSSFAFQLDMSASTNGLDIVHPIAFFLAERFSYHLGKRSMLCLFGVEHLGALFENGELKIDHLEEYQHIYRGTPWKYSPCGQGSGEGNGQT